MAGMVGSSVFKFVSGVTHETFDKDEDFRSGTISTVAVGKARIKWDDVQPGDLRTRDGIAYVYVDKSRLTKIERETYVLDLEVLEVPEA